MSTVLIVDDDGDFVNACRKVLVKEGYEVVGANSSAEGWEALEGNPPDVLILDVMMQQGDDGIIMSQEMRRKGIKVPILMLSGVGRVMVRQFDRDDAMIPVDAFMAKPVSPRALVETIQELLSSRKDRNNAGH